MKKKSEPINFERRWPVGAAIIFVIAILTMLPERVMLVPPWAIYVLGTTLILPMVFVAQSKAGIFWIRFEKTVMMLFIITNITGILINLSFLIKSIISQSSGLSGLQLLTSGVAIWVNNVIAFSLLYWQIDCGGPEARVGKTGIIPDMHFPQYDVPGEIPEDWRPVFADYLFLGFTTATAFSPTDVLPLTPRAKMLMMLESAVSLVTLAVVASRAINILGN